MADGELDIKSSNENYELTEGDDLSVQCQLIDSFRKYPTYSSPDIYYGIEWLNAETMKPITKGEFLKYFGNFDYLFSCLIAQATILAMMTGKAAMLAQ